MIFEHIKTNTYIGLLMSLYKTKYFSYLSYIIWSHKKSSKNLIFVWEPISSIVKLHSYSSGFVWEYLNFGLHAPQNFLTYYPTKLFASLYKIYFSNSATLSFPRKPTHAMLIHHKFSRHYETKSDFTFTRESFHISMSPLRMYNTYIHDYTSTWHI